MTMEFTYLWPGDHAGIRDLTRRALEKNKHAERIVGGALH